MNLTELTAISPVDGRYRNKTHELASYFSEWALIKYRLQVEIEYFLVLCELPLPQLLDFPKQKISSVKSIYLNFAPDDGIRIKEIERITNHDVKAIEYYLKEQFDQLNLGQFKEFIHFGLTSQDINNTAVPLSIKEAIEQVYLPVLLKLNSKLKSMSDEWQDIPMLARTHGQPASPTRLGKEILVFVDRLEKQIEILEHLPYPAKFGGATGNFNAHVVAYPDINWVEVGNHLVNIILKLDRSQVTTQIEHYDNLAAIFDCLRRIQVIMVDLSRDIWTYISMGYFKQKIRKGEVGSSTMPHKVNPIDFENAEGNFGIANAIFDHLSEKLPISRLQRDLTDSTVLRNIGVPLAHGLIAMKSLQKGLDKLLLNEDAINKDLEDNWAVISEAIQTILRRENYPNPYEALKELTRKNVHITKDQIHLFIDTLDVKQQVKEELKAISPWNYLGVKNLRQ
ncbi:MAG: adenylosuccinate lyase [Porphyromonadaceae bacterium]|nr:MAG: adenylosuccinate lyase [Porphyromonadaceae bacterium]